MTTIGMTTSAVTTRFATTQAVACVGATTGFTSEILSFEDISSQASGTPITVYHCLAFDGGSWTLNKFLGVNSAAVAANTPKIIKPSGTMNVDKFDFRRSGQCADTPQPVTVIGSLGGTQVFSQVISTGIDWATYTLTTTGPIDTLTFDMTAADCNLIRVDNINLRGA